MRFLEQNLSLEYITSQAFLVTELFHYYFLIKPFLKVILTFKSQVNMQMLALGAQKSQATQIFLIPSMETTKDEYTRNVC